MEVSGRACKAAIIQLNGSGRSIDEMEEALVVQSLHREDGLTQTEIAVLLCRYKSWVSRRISLIERLSKEVQEDIRLWLISVITGSELAKLPRGNQKGAANAILKCRYTTREAAKLIRYLLSRPGWEYSVILASPWEVVEQRPPKPRGLGPTSCHCTRSARLCGAVYQVQPRKEKESLLPHRAGDGLCRRGGQDPEGRSMKFLRNRQELNHCQSDAIHRAIEHVIRYHAFEGKSNRADS
jgi:hypothetical protein